MTFTDQIIEKCDCSQGLTISQLASALGRKNHDVNAMAGLLAKQGRLHKAGVLRFFRYFKAFEHALAWQLIAQQDYELKRAEAKIKARETRNAARRKDGPPGRPKNARQDDVVTPNEIRQTKPVVEVQPKIHSEAIWPKDLVIQAFPTPPGKYAFNPPKGWIGEFTQDWMDRTMHKAGSTKLDKSDVR